MIVIENKQLFTQNNFENPLGYKHTAKNYNLFEKQKRIFSQHGEDGIIEYIYSVVQPKHKFYVEFGATSGNWIENSRNLRVNHKWSGLLMEGDKNLADKSEGLVKCEMVSSANIMNLFEKYNVPYDFDFLSIDVDGDDFYIFKSIDTKKYTPSVIVLEYNPALPNICPLVIEEGKSAMHETPITKYASGYYGCNIAAWHALSIEKEYSIITTTGVNVILLKNDLLKLFDFTIPDIKDLIYPPYFIAEQNRFDDMLTLPDSYKWFKYQ